MTSDPLVLLVEDDSALAAMLTRRLELEGIRVVHTGRGGGVVEQAAELVPDAVVLDIGLPDVDGLTVCRRLRESGDLTPVLFLTARGDEVDRIVGLGLGADDYVTKPFSPRELAARVQALVRRREYERSAPRSERRRMGPLVVAPAERRAVLDGLDLELTATEFDLLAHLISAPGQVFSRRQLLDAVWGSEQASGARTVDVHVAQLRAKLGAVRAEHAALVGTVRGVGYVARAGGEG